MSMCRVFSCVVGKGCLLWPVCSLGKTLLAFALFNSVLQGQICLLLQVSLDFLVLHSSPLWWGFPGGSEVKASAPNVGDPSLIPGSGRSLGEGNGYPLQYSCLENPMNNMKRQNDRILKEELHRLVDAQYATGDQWRNNSRKNEGMEPKQKQYSVLDVDWW